MRWRRLGESGIWTARYGFTGGVSRSVIVETSRGVLVYSPGRDLVGEAREVIGSGAEVVLVAPSGGHTLGIGAWLEEFEGSRVMAAEVMVRRVREKSLAREVGDVRGLEGWLPEHVRVHVVPGSGVGEVWVSVEEGGKVYWLVCDSIMNIAALDERRLIRWLQRAYGLDTGLTVGRVFRLGVRDRRGFSRWARARLADGREHVLVPCHGEIDDGPELGRRVVELIERRFGGSGR